MKRNLLELVAAGFFGMAAIAGFAATQTRQAYDLTQIEFCPVSKSQKGQLYLDRTYCNQPRYVLTEEWDRYGGYNSVIPYKGNAIQWVRDLPTDNHHQLESNAIAIVGLWGVAACFTVRSQRLKRRDYELGEAEKTDGYTTWLSSVHRREVKQHSTALHTERLKDGLTAMDTEERKALGLTDEENENAKSRIQFEDFIKARAVNHSAQDKTIAENLLAKAKADKERAKTESKVKEPEQVSADEDLKHTLINALKNHEDGYLWKIINSLKPLWLIGNQGSGKTYTATAIALIRKYCLDAPIHQLIDRHATGDNADVWKLLDAASKAESESEISLAFEDCCERWLTRIKQKPTTKQQVIVDEFTNLKSLCGESAIAFFKMSLTDTRKAKEYLLGITHNATNESFPDGTASARKSGTVLLEKFSANGETPLKRVVVRYGLVDEQGNNLDDVEKTLPDWFHPEQIYQHFNGKPLSFED
ncbi:hypothetical protein PI95_031025 [Hassallia byssoidea VB512170]|uniref:ATPase AAA-type core domain-containing protein n=1 Tax=Hassallia byssoidea VB512170 TaxID=1304833 RepID=A0A846HID6_9CYAN|nr:hypothetical protein [Hassalia byssoidea]NEU76823.1 hypothetical protein [Hassalia byssoidea VB512170]